MAAPKRSKIGYCDYSGGDLNPVLGCTPISAGCANCYARRIYERFGKDFSKVTVYPDKLEHLLKWQPKPPYKRGPGSRPLAFVCNMSDLFHEDVPRDFIFRFLDVAWERHMVDWLVLTKRAGRMRGCVRAWCDSWQGDADKSLAMPANLWLGVTVENEDNLWRIDELLKTPAAVRFVSLEPMLEAIDLGPWLYPYTVSYATEHPAMRLRPGRRPDNLHWVVIGGESGPKQRPLMWDWAWEVLDQCREAGVPCFLKQDAGPRPNMPLYGRDGRQVKEWPRGRR